jgi:hypothetical protein
MLNVRTGMMGLAGALLLMIMAIPAFAQEAPFFTPGNIVVAVAGCGVYGGTPPNTTPSSTACATEPLGGTGIGYTGYGDDQASVWTLFQYTPNGASSVTYVNSLQLPQTASGANSAVTNDFGSQSEGTIQLSGNGEYLTMMGYGINAAEFNVNYLLYCPGSTMLSNACVPENGNPATAQTGSLTAPQAGVSGTTAVPRVAILIDANGNVNTSTALYNIFDENDARSAYSPDGVNIYVSGQGCKTCGPTPNQISTTGNYDNTMGVYYSAVGAANTSPTAITGNDNGPTGCSTPLACTSSEDTRMVQIYNNTLYVSTDAKPGSSAGYNRSYIGTLGDPPSTSLFTCTGVGGGCGTGYGPYGPAEMTGFGNTGGTGKVTITAGANGNGLNVITFTGSVSSGSTTLTAPSGTFSSADVGDTVSGTGIPSGTTITAETSSSTATMSNAATATNASDSISIGLLINISPQNFFFASPTVLYVADTGSPKNSSNNDTICSTDGGGSKSVGDGGLQKWTKVSTTFMGGVTSGSKTVTAPSGTFSYLDVGLPISGTDIPSGTTIASVTSSTSAKLSASATATDASDSITLGPAWSLAYTLYQGLDLVLNVNCDTANSNTTGPGSTGLYGLAGVVNGGVATLYTTIYPNDDLIQSYLYGITDTLTTTANPGTAFTLLDTAPAGSVFRGVSFVPTIPAGSVEITSSPSGATVTTSGSGCDPSTITTPLTEAWTPSSTCTLSVTSPQTVAGTQYTFAHWQDSTTSTSDVVTAPSTTATYTATFSTAYQLTTAAGSGGTVSSGGYYSAGANATITATPSGGNCFANFTAAAQIGWTPLAASTSNPYTLQMNSPQSITANFAALGISSPASGSTFSSNSVTFSWSACAAASAYYLDLGATEGSNGYLDSGSLSGSTTSYSVTDLPTNGSTVWARWYYNVNGSWSYIDASYTSFNAGGVPGGDSIATISSPAPSSTLSGPSVTFSWTAGTGPTLYNLDIGSTVGGNNYYSQQTSSLSAAVTGLPVNGSTVYVTLYSEIGGTWYSNPYTYTAATSALAVMQSPTPSTMLSGSSVAFTWSTGSGVTQYWLDVGSSAGGNQYYSQSESTNTTATVSGLPVNGSTVYVTLYSYINSQWQSNAYTYTAFNPSAAEAVISSPTSGSTLTGSSVTFTWNSVAGAQAYWLDLGSTSGGNQYYSQNQGTGLSVTVGGLPTNGSQVYATLYTEFSGTWYSNSTSYTAATNTAAVITAPSPGSPLTGASQAFTWSTGSGVTQYSLDAGSTSGGNQYYSQNEGTNTTATVTGLPVDGSTVYVTLWSLINGSWTSNTYTFTAALPATMTSPANGSSTSGGSATFIWSTGTSVTNYYIDIGSSAGANDIYSASQGTNTTATINGLPTNGETIYVTLYSLIGGTYYSTQTSYTAGP